MAIEDELMHQVGHVELKTYRVRDILPNPYRHTGYYPIVAEKVESLCASYKATGFWSNIVVRPFRNGQCQQAYGHHRHAALEKLYGGDHEVSVLVAAIDDATMLRVMAHENMEEWGPSPIVTMETVRAVVKAYAKGDIELGELGEKVAEHVLRHAPSFRSGASSIGPIDHPYTATQVSDFIGLPRNTGEDAPTRVRYALSALELIEVGALDEKQLRGLKANEFRVVVEEARKDWTRAQREAAEAEKAAAQASKKADEAKTLAEKRQAEKEATTQKKKAKATRERGAKTAKKVGEKVAGVYKGKEKATEKDARKAANKTRGNRQVTEKNVEKFGNEIYTTLVKLLQDDNLKEKLDALLSPDTVDYVPASIKKSLTNALTGLGKRASLYADRFKTAAEPRMRTVQTSRRQLA